MNRNMGPLDRRLRVVAAAILLSLGAATSIGDGTWLEWALYIFGGIALLTAAVGNCPLYTVLGIKTCRAC